MGNTVGNVLISYDVNKSHTQVKTELENRGYLNYFTYKNDTNVYYLPNTTLWHPKITSSQAMIDLKNICRNLGVKLEKGVSVKADEFVEV